MTGVAITQLAIRVVLALIFVVAGVLHFTATRQYAAIMPGWVPLSANLVVQITGVMEVAGGVGLLVPALLRPAGICLILFLVAVFPANVVAAQHNVPLMNPIWARGLAQVVLIAAIGWVALFPKT
ncbi:MAG: DoxX family protein [Ktedonobacterales bacterium]|nr:DoxX family protein [Ktedonobacterales bacterium]